MFAPSVYNKRNYTKFSTSVGSEVNIECTSKDYKYENNYFHSNCHLKSTSDTFFRQQDLKYSNYKLNITTLKQEDFELKRVLKSDEFNYKYKFIKKISQYPKIYNRDIRYFIDKIEQLYMYEKSLNSYLENIKNKLSALLKNKKDNFSIDEIKKIKDKIKVVSESIQANKEIMQIQKKLFFSNVDIDKLEDINKKIDLDKLFLTNKYYKYQVLHFIDLSSKNRLNNFMNKLHKKERIAGKSFQKELLNCWGKRMRSRYFGLCIELKGITTQKSKQDIKVILNKISALRRILLMQYGINIRYSIID